ncbi:hypothetical protein [Fusobacterium ulcerans]|uniref:hypothetical protein n=1 Tax=Fusobacterium ulcerans TaxID=861 RepID=UPI002E76A519|nr:hypothetical protein [Fusobacterium ulcerans]MEE0138201.1 hypothetical protein [Fusobacterium ulcerans]
MAAGRDQLLIEIQAIIDNSVLKESEKILGEIEKQSKKTEKSLDQLGSSFGKIGALVAGVLSAKKIKEGIDLATDFEESRSKLEDVFGENIKTVDRYISNMSNSLRLGRRQLETEMADVGGVLAGMGFEEKDLVLGTGLVIELSKDIAAFGNTDFETAQKGLLSGLTGQAQTLKNLGVLIQDQDMEEFIKTLAPELDWKDLSNGEKSYMRLIAVREKMKKQKSIGYAEKEKDNFSSLRKEIESLTKTMTGDFFVGIKDALQPSLLKTAEFLNENKDKMKELGASVGEVVGKILDIVGAISDFVMKNQSLVKSVGIAIGVMYGLSTVIGIVNALMTANPIGLVVVAIGALVAGLVYAYQESETFRAIVDGAFSMLKEAAKVVFPLIKKDFEILMAVIKKTGEILGIVFGKIKESWDWLVNSKAGKFVAKLMGSDGKEIDISVSEEETGKAVKEETDKILKGNEKESLADEVDKIAPKMPKSTNQDAKVIKEKVDKIEEKTNITEKEVVTRTKENKNQKIDLNIKIDVQTISIDLQERLQKVVRSELESYEREQLVNVGLI